MDELRSKIVAWSQIGNELVEYDKMIEDFLNSLEQHSLIAELNVEKISTQTKKKRNILSNILNCVSENPNEITENINAEQLPQTKKSFDPIARQTEKIMSEQQQANERPGCAGKGNALKSSDRERTIRPSNNNIKLSSEIKTEPVSDDENDKMPPPTQSPPKTKKKLVKSSASSTVDKIMRASQCKQEKLDSPTRPKRSNGKGKRGTIKSQTSNSQESYENDENRNCDLARKESVYDPGKSTGQEVNNLCVGLAKVGPTDLGCENLDNNTFNDTRANDPAGDTFTVQQDQTNSNIEVPQIKENGSKSELITVFKSETEETNVLGFPAVTRSTRNKSRVKNLKDNCDTNTPVRRLAQLETRATDSKPKRIVVPKETIVILNSKKKINSTSKLLHGDISVEELKRNALQMAAEEKKRKREDKQKQAQLIRAAKEREKREAAERVAREKQEKCKRILHDREEKVRQENEEKKILREHKLQNLHRNLEEIQKNLQISKQIEQKREDIALQEVHNKKLAVKVMRDEINHKAYDFDLLMSDDSTDDEDTLTTRKPPPPIWSLSKVRQPVIRQQNYIEWEIVDKLFSVKPMTIDLQEIFPTIDSQCLVRNSSVIWSTPPRYSQLPKY